MATYVDFSISRANSPSPLAIVLATQKKARALLHNNKK